MSRSDEDRFSVLILERDVLAYRKFKIKYQYFQEKYQRLSSLREANNTQERERCRQEMEKWYNLYINKMRYLEKNYRKTKIYTKYHAQLENKSIPKSEPFDPDKLPTVVARPVSPIQTAVATRFTPSAPPIPELYEVNYYS
tara:strand:- start:1368 stop:1790 length:423 start_codon:yes stop_codon:yes gene_type:complete